RHFDNEAIEPFGRNKVEQRRCGDEIERAIEGEFEVAREIERRGRDVDVGRMFGGKGPRQKTETVVHQPPALTRWKMGSHRSQRRAGATGEIDDRDRFLPKERVGDRIEHLGVARGEIVGFAQGQPLGGKAAHARLSKARANSAACSFHDGNLAARAPAARRSRSCRFAMSRCNVPASASTSSGATSTPASVDTVCGIAPAVVPMTGTPWAMASV